MPQTSHLLKQCVCHCAEGEEVPREGGTRALLVIQIAADIALVLCSMQ